jgi:hypothetical protein
MRRSFETVARALQLWRHVAASALVLWFLPNGACAQARLVISDATVPFEGNTGTDIATFTVTFQDTTTATASVLFSTANGTATGGTQCGAGVDYVSLINGALQFSATQRTRQVVITICGDVRDEVNEAFTITLFSATGATIQDATGQATIMDDDSGPTLNLTNVTVPEGNAPNVANAVFSVSMSGLTDHTVTANFATANGTATGGAACGAGADYVSRNGVVTFPPSPANQSSTTPATQQIMIQICGDAIYEGTQQYQLRLTNPANATLLGQGTATGSITDNESPPTLRITTPTVAVTEPADPTQTSPANFTVELAGSPFEGTVTVSYATSIPNAADAAEAGNCLGSALPFSTTPIAKADFCSKAGTLSFTQPGQQRVITIDVRGDQHNEPAERFLVTISNAQRALIAAGQSTGTATIAASP